jgi:hypothetical protein
VKKGALVAAIAAVGVCALLLTSPLFAARGASPNNPKADIQLGNAACGADLSALPVIGFTNYHRQGNVVSFQFHLKDAVPNTTYRIELWGNACSFFGITDTITTNSKGVANSNSSLTVPAASTRFFATAWGPNGYNDTPAVTLTP